jgi:uncharacterized protein YbbK (DUF523 family)
MIGVSSCLAGCKCTYSGDDKLIKLVKEMVMRNEAIMICPEVLGGLSIPRSPCEIRDGKVVDINGNWSPSILANNSRCSSHKLDNVFPANSPSLIVQSPFL